MQVFVNSFHNNYCW